MIHYVNNVCGLHHHHHHLSVADVNISQQLASFSKSCFTFASHFNMFYVTFCTFVLYLFVSHNLKLVENILDCC